MCHICIMLWRGLKLEFRDWVKFILELLVFIACFTMVVVRPKVLLPPTRILSDRDRAIQPNFTLKHHGDLEELCSLSTFSDLMGKDLESFTLGCIEECDEELGQRLGIRMKEYKSLYHLLANFEADNLLAGVWHSKIDEIKKKPGKILFATANWLVFHNKFQTIHPKSKHAQYFITRDSSILTTSDMAADDKYKNTSLFIREGILPIIYAQLKTIYGKVAEKPLPKAQLYSYESLDNDYFLDFIPPINYIARHCFCFCYFFPFLHLLYKYGREREDNILAHHWQYGIENYTYWLVHIIYSLLRLLLLDLMILPIWKLSQKLIDTRSTAFFENHINYAFMFLVANNMAMILTAICIVSLIRSARISVLVGMALWIVFYLLTYFGIEEYDVLKSQYLYYTIMMFFHANYVSGVVFMEPAKFDNRIFSMTLKALYINIGIVLTVLLLTLHFLPGYYKCTSFNFLSIFRDKSEKRKDKTMMQQSSYNRRRFEEAPLFATEMMSLRNISTNEEDIIKRNGSLKNISFNVYQGEITVILGHHNAGKTTLISVMAGWWKPSDGQILVDNMDIYRYWKKKGTQIDLCMADYNPLYSKLSASEMLKYYLRIKMPAKTKTNDLKLEIQKWIRHMKPAITNLDMRVNKMTFEQKRFLSLCCALSFNTKIVLLDEPTLLMRPEETRYYWEILRHEKSNRAIVLTTLSALEAETFGDRIAIISDGSLLSYGTPFFLKQVYNKNYYLIITKPATVPVDPITDTIRKIIADVVPEDDVDTQLIYMIPAHHRASLQGLLIALEREVAKLEITDMYIFSGDFNKTYLLMHRNHDRLDISTRKWPTRAAASNAFSRDSENSTTENTNAKKIYAGNVMHQILAVFQRKIEHQAAWPLPLVVIVLNICVIIWFNFLVRDMTPPIRNEQSLASVQSVFSIIQTQKFPTRYLRLEFSHMTQTLGRTKSTQFTRETDVPAFDKSALKLFKSVSDLPRTAFFIEKGETNYTLIYNERDITAPGSVIADFVNYALYDAHPDPKHEIFIGSKIQPVPISIRTHFNLNANYIRHIMMPMIFGIVIPLTISCYITELVQERRSQMLHLQVLSGLRMDIYWIVNLIWDSTMFTLNCIVLVIFICEHYYTGTAKIATLGLLLLYSLPALAMIYFISMFRCIQSKTTAYFIVLVFQLITGPFAYLMYWDIADVENHLFYIASLSPAFVMVDGVSRIYTAYAQAAEAHQICVESYFCDPLNMCDSFPLACEKLMVFDETGIMPQICILIATFFIFMLAICIFTFIEKQRKYHVPRNIKAYRTVCHPYDDDDVVKTRQTIAQADLETCRKWRFVVDQVENKLTKKSTFLRTVSFAALGNECVGIYGARKSGKSFFIQKLCGLRKFCFGDVYVLSHALKEMPQKAMSHMSYCPQTNESFNFLTPRQLMTYFCLLRGFSSDDNIYSIIRHMSDSLRMTKLLNRQFYILPVEYKRKTLIALTLIVDSDVAFFDEPTRGLRLFARHEVWSVMRTAKADGKTIIFTTNDAEECDHLADKMIIFDDGEMWAIGAPHFLRHQFSVGIYMDFKLRFEGATHNEIKDTLEHDITNLHRLAFFLHPMSVLRSRSGNHLYYFIPIPVVRYSFLFGFLERHYKRMNVVNYTVNGISMEEVMRTIDTARHHRMRRLRR